MLFSSITMNNKHEFMDLVHHKLLSIAINNPDHLFS